MCRHCAGIGKAFSDDECRGPAFNGEQSSVELADSIGEVDKAIPQVSWYQLVVGLREKLSGFPNGSSVSGNDGTNRNDVLAQLSGYYYGDAHSLGIDELGLTNSRHAVLPAIIRIAGAYD